MQATGSGEVCDLKYGRSLNSIQASGALPPLTAQSPTLRREL